MKNKFSKISAILFLFFSLLCITSEAWSVCDGADMTSNSSCMYGSGFGTVGGALSGSSSNITGSSMYPFSIFMVDNNVLDCAYILSPTSQQVNSSGGTGGISVTAAPSNCSGTWTATSNNSSWLTITSGNSGTSSGTVNYSYTANTTTSTRTGTMTIGGQTVTITQAGLNAFLLSAIKTGTGTGKITSSPTGIDCGAVCNFSFIENTAVTLTATPNSLSTFTGWSGGGCSGTNTTCTLTLTVATNVTANFETAVNTLSINKSGKGTGTVSSSDGKIDCGNTCSGTYTNGTTVTLTASPSAATGSTFGGWSGGGCKGADTLCTVTMDSTTKAVTAIFNSATAEKAKAIIIAGSESATDNVWTMVKELAGNAYTTLKLQGYAAENITYLTLDQNSDRSKGLPTGDNLKKALEGASGADSLVLYMIGHGGTGIFRTSSSDIIQASDLNAWLNTLQQTMKGEVTVIYEACRSGSFIDPLKHSNRLVVTSASADTPATLLDQGDVSFSGFFWNSIKKGKNLNDAFVRAKNGIALSVAQTPQMDADGNGTPGETNDKQLAATIKIGNALTNLGDNPTIGNISPDIQLTGGTTSAEIYAESITASADIAEVWAYITPPASGANPDQFVTNLTKVGLTKDSRNSGRYKATYDGFILKGEYLVSVYARDVDGNISEPMLQPMKVMQTAGTSAGDICAATLAGSGLVHEPYFVFGGAYYWLDLQYAQDAQFPATDIMFELPLTPANMGIGVVANTAAYSSCQAANLEAIGSDVVLHIPSLIFNGVFFPLDLTYVPTTDGKIWFKVRI